MLGSDHAPDYRLSVAQYHQMAEAGILTEDDRVELLGGRLVPKMTKNPPHIDAVYRVFEALLRLVPEGYCVNKEDPLVTADSVPEPDCVVLRGRRETYRHRLPTAADVALVVEVADASLRQDRVEKKRIYAEALIPAYWVVNLPARRVEVYSDPTGPADPTDTPDYRVRRDYGPDDELPVLIDGRELGRLLVRDLLPEPAA